MNKWNVSVWTKMNEEDVKMLKSIVKKLFEKQMALEQEIKTIKESISHVELLQTTTFRELEELKLRLCSGEAD